VVSKLIQSSARPGLEVSTWNVSWLGRGLAPANLIFSSNFRKIKRAGASRLPDLEISPLGFERGFLTADNSKNAPPQLVALERDVEARSGVLKKELGLFDLVLTQIVFVVGTFWVGWAARLGHEQNVFWILSILTFYVPLAVAVIFLNRLMPLEGGLYQWTKLAFNEFVGFMVGWNL